MGRYKPLYIKDFKTGLVQNRVDFLLPNDAYPILENAYIFRETIRRKQGVQLLGRLRRKFSEVNIGNAAASDWNFNIFTIVSPMITETNKEIEPGSVVITIQAGPDIVFTDQGNGTLTSPTAGNSGTINYITGAVVLTHTGVGSPTLLTFNYFPGLPVMGLRTKELNDINFEQTIAFDTVYAYRYIGGWEELLPLGATRWTGNDSDFFWTTNYWVDSSNRKIFWATNFSGTSGDPIRYTNAISNTWIDFTPQISLTESVFQCRAMLPFRGRMVLFNTFEGTTGGGLAGSIQKPQRIRWAKIGNPFTTAAPPIVTTVVANAWRDDIKGNGGFLDIPTSQNIVSVGFVRDNLVVYCERSTWQLRYTGQAIQPFQIEKVNSELGAESTFSAVQFDSSLLGIGDKGVVECDSFKSERIDIKIPDLVFKFNNDSQGPKRVHGIRNFQQRIAYWTYPYKGTEKPAAKFPNRRLIYNYENDSWAIFTDSLTCLGTFQPIESRTWAVSNFAWAVANFPWLSRPSGFPAIVGGNQQGFVLYLDQQTTNDISLAIQDITGNTTTPTVITSRDHNLDTGQVIKIKNLQAGMPFATSLNNGIFAVVRLGPDTFELWKYNVSTGQFSDPQLDAPATYGGGGRIAIRDNFSIVSKKFNFLEEGQNIQIGYVDALLNATTSGEVTLYAYLDYNDNSPINTLPQNINPNTNRPDTFFNTVVPTSISASTKLPGSKYWKRVFLPVRGGFITLEWTLSNAQMVSIAQESDVQIESQIIFMRPAGRQLPVGV